MTSGSSMFAITLSVPPHRKQRSISIAKTRLRRCAQVIARWRCTSVLSGGAVSPTVPDPATTRDSSALAVAKTPWLLLRRLTLSLLDRDCVGGVAGVRIDVPLLALHDSITHTVIVKHARVFDVLSPMQLGTIGR